jgi:hypothetical protein
MSTSEYRERIARINRMLSECAIGMIHATNEDEWYTFYRLDVILTDEKNRLTRR